jgi:hypothetical protein
VELVGPSPLANDLPLALPRRQAILFEWQETLRDGLEVAALELRTERLHRPVDLSQYRSQPHVLGESLRLLEEVLAGSESLPNLDPRQLTGFDPERHARPQDYFAELREGLDAELVQRLLEEAQS